MVNVMAYKSLIPNIACLSENLVVWRML